MDIRIDEVNVQLEPGVSLVSPQMFGKLVEAVLKEILRGQADKLRSAHERSLRSSVEEPNLKVRPGASDEEIARVVADALSRTILRELEVRP